MGPIYYVAVIVAGIVGFAIGAVWYTLLFSRQWIAAVGVNEADIRRNRTITPFLVAMVSYFLMAAVIAAVAPHDANVLTGALTGLLLWLGFGLTVTAVNYVFAARKGELTAIDAGHWLAVAIIMGGVIGAF
jgi:hypothetical protein